jgi:hypothetical protein
MNAGSKRKKAGNDAAQAKSDSVLFFARKLKGDDDYDADGFFNDINMTIDLCCDNAGLDLDVRDAYRFLIECFKEILDEA